jgi:hypothetical protein
MAKSNKNTPKPSVPKKRRSRKGVALKRYNKLLSITLSDYKKKGIEYDLKEVRKEVSSIYPDYKNIAPSRIRKKEVIKSVKGFKPKEEAPEKDTFTIKATEVPKYWFDEEINWFDLDKWIIPFNEAYPEIPIVITSKNNELRIKGDIGGYSGSLLQEFVNEELREEFENDSPTMVGGIFFGIPAWQDRPDKQYAFWGTMDAPLPPNVITDYDELEPRVEKEIEKREEEVKKKQEERKKQEKKKLPKDKKKKVVPPKEVPAEPKRQPTPLADKNRAKEILLEEFKLGIWTKDEYREKANKIDNMYSKGGKL